MSHIRIELVGRSPLVCHNIALADPDNEIVKEIKALTSKRTKTEDDRRAIERLEWFGGLYTAPGIEGPAMPTANVRKCLIRGGVITRQGTQVGRALSFSDLFAPVVFDGPRDLETLWADTAYRYRTPVGVGNARTIRMRPVFPRWSLVLDAYLLEDLMDPGDMDRVIEHAGLSEGLGDNRANGYGRFEGRVVAA